MRKLEYEINVEKFKEIKGDIVPTLFTQHQFELIEKKMTGKKLTPSERNEFSRTVSRKMKAINKILEKDAGGIFVYGKEKMLPERLSLAVKYVKDFSRKFKNNQVLISGSFLYSEKHNDIDVFVISKYDKDDFHLGKFHINYLTEDVRESLFFASLKKLCVTNKKIELVEIKEDVNLDTFISIYQELFGDLARGFSAIKNTLREFLLQASFIARRQIFDSKEIRDQISSVLKLKRPKEIIKKIFVETVVLGANAREALKSMNEMIKKYKDVSKEYPQHKVYYTDIMQPFQEVISIES